LYGLRRSGLRWYCKLTAKLKEIGLQPTERNSCLFEKLQEDKPLLVTIYVDDLLLASNHPEWLRETKEHLINSNQRLWSSETYLVTLFEQSDENQTVFICEEKYVGAILKQYGMLECKPALTPMESKSTLKRPGEPNENGTKRYIIGSLMFLAVSTRQEIGCAVNFISHFKFTLTSEHWKASKRLFDSSIEKLEKTFTAS